MQIEVENFKWPFNKTNFSIVLEIRYCKKLVENKLPTYSLQETGSCDFLFLPKKNKFTLLNYNAD